MATDLQAVLEELTGYPSTDQPFLSVYLDMRPDGNGRRTEMLQTLEQEFERIAASIKNRSGNLESFESDRQRIMEYVNRDAPLDVQGLAIFACNAEGIWQELPLNVPVPNEIVEDRYAHVFNLARILDDYETYAVVLADAEESRIFVISLNRAEKAAETESYDEVKRFEAGGWGQMLFQRRMENVVRAHTKEIADKLSRLIKRYDVQHVIIAANDSIKGHVRASLSKDIQDRLVDLINLDVTSNIQEMMQAIEPLMREVERQQEAEDVDTLEAQVNTKGGMGVIGIADTALALSKGQVRLLIMHQNFQAPGSLNPNTNFLYAGVQQKDPFDGSDLESVDLREAFIARSQQQGATVQIVEANDYLEQHEGVGALLWYRDDVKQPQQLEGQQSSMEHGA